MDQTPAAPPVVAVVVTQRADADLDAVFAGLAAQDYPALRTIIIDLSGAETVAAHAGDVVSGAFVRRLPHDTGPLAAANEVLRLVEGAAFYLFLDPSTVLETSAVRALIEEAYRSNAGILGPKLLDPHDPTRLADVGAAIDKFAVAAPLVEPGERDQEQHDAVHDVFWIHGAVLAVRADLFAALGGFDTTLSPAAGSLDLCWRAHLAAARVLVVPAARAHLREPLESRDLPPAERLRLLATLYSVGHMARVLPQFALLSIVRAVSALVHRQPRESARELTAWPATVARLGTIRAGRARVKKTREVPDSDVRALQVRGSAQLMVFLRGQLADRDVRHGWIGRLGQATIGLIRGGRPWRVILTWLAVATVLVVGSRQLITGVLPAVGELLPVRTSAVTLLRTYANGWHDIGLGTSAPAPTGLALVAGVVAVCLGATALARTVLLVGALLVGVAGAWRLTRAVGVARGRLLGLIAYAAAPVGVNALAKGSVAGLVGYASAPWVLARLARASRLEPFDEPRGLPREILGLGLLVAVATAFVPAYPLVIVLMVAAMALASPFAGGRAGFGRVVVVSAGGLIVGVGLNLPWLFDVYRSGGAWAAIGAVKPASPLGPTLGRLLVFHSGPIGSVLGAGLAAAAFVAVVVSRGWRASWAIRGCAIATVFLAVAWADGRGWLPRPFAMPELFLASAAAAIALAVSMGGAAVDLDVRSARLTLRQPLAFLSSVAVVVAAVPMIGGMAGGRWHLPRLDFDRTFTFLSAPPEEGRFRVLWLGDPRALPLRGWWLNDGLSYAVSSGGRPDIAALWPGTPSRATRLIRDMVEIAGDGRTDRLGRLLAPMAIRYVVVPVRSAPAASNATALPVPDTLISALGSQLDLRKVDIDDALYVYENTAWIPARAVLSPGAAAASAESDPAALAATDLGTSTPVLPGGSATNGRGPVPAGIMYLAQASSARWRLQVDGTSVARRPAFGWANAFTVPVPGQARLSYRTPLTRRFALLGQLVAWLVVVGVLVRGRRRYALVATGAVPERDTVEPEPELDWSDVEVPAVEASPPSPEDAAAAAADEILWADSESEDDV